MIKTYEQLKWEMDIIDEFIEKAYEGLIIVDQEGKITKFKYERLLDVKEEEVIGKHVTEVVENTRLHIVLKTGQPEIGDIQTIKGHNVVTSRIPIIRNGITVGAVGTILFKDILEVQHMAEHIDQMKRHVKKYKQDLKRLNIAKYTFDQIQTKDKRMQATIDLAKKAALTNSSIFVEGQSGTGKEYFAHAIHEASYRKYGPFVKINCASIPENLIESELFGYEPGAFTGASNHGKIGKFELANGGTLFLDELNSMPLEMQGKLLRIVEERELERIGGNQRIPLDIRFITACNEDLLQLVSEGKFRSDLFYRLNVVHLKLPTLKERKRDISMFANQILTTFSLEYPKCPKIFSKEAMYSLESYHWPGNIRELRNVIESAINQASGNTITVSHLPEFIKLDKPNVLPVEAPESGDLKSILDQMEIKIILDAIKQSSGNRTEAAKRLGIHRTALYKKLNKYDI